MHTYTANTHTLTQRRTPTVGKTCEQAAPEQGPANDRRTNSATHTHAYKLTCSAVVAAAARKVVYAAAAAAAAFSAGFQCRRRRRTRIRIWLLCALVEIEIKI